ncbi:2-aminoethylphosphonate--pyruvate transaminase [Paenibacillus sp. P1XP2]|nr:2-aminoethylphosphonate--pyruvate transaminase [Paenibacillus sp. P1XP2]
MNNYKLLTPGPLTTTAAVKEEMLFDRCTWDDDYKSITQKIRSQLLSLAGAGPDEYTAVLMQGSGTFAVESVMTSAVSDDDKVLIVTNGAYGERIVQMAEYIGLNYTPYRVRYDAQPEETELRAVLAADPDITHIAMVHCETTTGILNPLETVAKLSKEYGKTLIIDAMSSFGGIGIDVAGLGIDYLISSANKCIQGVPGFGFVIAKLDKLKGCQASRAACPWTCTTNGKEWTRTANGGLLPLPTSWRLFRKRWMSLWKKAGFRRGRRVIAKITVCFAKSLRKSAFRPIFRKRSSRRSSRPFYSRTRL